MSKKKKNKEKYGRPQKPSWHESLKPETKHSLWAVFSLALGLLFTLAYFGKGGPAGAAAQRGLNIIFGKGFFLVSLSFFLASLSFLFALGNHLVLTTVVGGILFLISTLGISDIILGEFTGGYIGYLASYPFLKLFDFWASLVIFAALLLASLLIMLNFSLKPKRREGDSDENLEKEVKISQPALSNPQQTSLRTQEIAAQEGEKEKTEEDEEAHPILNMFTRTKPKLQKAEYKAIEYNFPPLDILEDDKGTPSSGDIKANANIVKRTLQNFGIDVEMSEVNVGPSVTQYTLKPAEGIKLSRITALQNDLALALAAHPLRIEAPIPGKSLVGIEIPNRSIALVGLRSLLGIEDFQKAAPLSITLGRDVSGREVFADIAKMPHLLIAGATGSGKSIAIHTLIISLLYKNSPEFLRFLMVDPKRVELTGYNEIPHLLTPVITDAKKTIAALRWAVREMERRYEKLSAVGTRDIFSYNNEMIKSKSPEEILPNIIIIIDELADLMAAYPREMEASIVRLAQMSRAVGIHLIVSTQRPSVEVITGLIKANITARVALQVASGVDSRTILDMSGAEKLLGNGDMLYLAGDTSKPRRIQGAFISEREVKRVVNFLSDQATEFAGAPAIDFDTKNVIATNSDLQLDGFEEGGGDVDDELYEEAKKLVIEAQKASASYLQRRLRVGYARAARLLDVLENEGIIGPGEGAKPRDVLIKKDDVEEALVENFEAAVESKAREEKKIEKAIDRVERAPSDKKKDADSNIPYTNFDF